MAHMINQMINLSYIFTVNSMDVIHSTCKYFEIINESASLKIMLYVFLTCATMPFLSCILLHRIKWILAANHFGISNQSICSLQFQYKERYLAGYISQNVLYGFAYMYLQLHKNQIIKYGIRHDYEKVHLAFEKLKYDFSDQTTIYKFGEEIP